MPNPAASSRPAETERRSAPRFVLGAGLPLRYPDLEATVRDISLAGAFISDKRPLRVGHGVRLSLPIETGPIEIQAIVRRVEPEIGMAVEFIGMTAASRERLHQLITELSAAANAQKPDA